MATTKKTTTARTRAPARRKAEPSFVATTERTIKKNPYASAAVATGVISAIAAAAAGFFAFKKSGKSFTDFSNDVATSVKDKAAEASDRVKDGLADAQTMAKDQVAKIRDGLDSSKSQSEISEEALSLKETGKKSTFPLDPVIEQQSKTGAITY
ncbi:MAG: hypothetical protein LH485_03720 [Sphingomonas bacterium]|nr:hypothetical protein [Sphingomonas bacterium]